MKSLPAGISAVALLACGGSDVVPSGTGGASSSASIGATTGTGVGGATSTSASAASTTATTTGTTTATASTGAGGGAGGGGGCTGSMMPGDYDEMVMSGADMRAYHLHVPPSYSPTEPTPLVLVFHGFTE